VLDTSVIITALRSPTGAAAEVVRLVLRGEFTILMDYKLACEYREVALRSEQLRASGKSPAETVAILDALEAVAEPVLVAFQYRSLIAGPERRHGSRCGHQRKGRRDRDQQHETFSRSGKAL